MSMHRNWVILLAIGLFPAVASGQTTAMTYQGQLKQNGSPVNGSFTMTFKLFDAVGPGGTQQGGTLTFDGAGGNPAPVSVTSGLFTVSLDFGVGPYTANAARWLEIAVNGTTLSPRQPLTPVPFALNSRGINVDSSGKIGIGTASPAQKLSVAGTVQSTSGGFMFPDGTTQVSAATGGTGLWTPSGANAFYNQTGNVGIGTINPQGKLDVRGYLVMDTGADAAIFTGTAGEQNRYLTLLNSPTFTSASGLKAGGILCSDSYFFANPGKNDLIVKGSVGVGVAAPTARLQVGGSGMTPFGIVCDSNSADPGANAIRGVISNVNFGGAFSCGVFGGNTANNGGFGVLGNHTGSGAGVRGDSVSGTGVIGTSQGASGYGGFFNNTAGDGVFGQSAGSARSGVAGLSTHANGYGGYFQNNAGGIAMRCNGRASVSILEVTGADVAERFPSSDANVEPGTVMEIDPDHPGKLRIARGPYNPRVAGVVSGAGDIPVGAILGNMPGQEDAPAVALSGRVWVKADATRQAIKVGDLLTTSDIPGRAMKAVDREYRDGAIIGKAMTALPHDSGLVLVLVNLQ